MISSITNTSSTISRRSGGEALGAREQNTLLMTTNERLEQELASARHLVLDLSDIDAMDAEAGVHSAIGCSGAGASAQAERAVSLLQATAAVRWACLLGHTKTKVEQVAAAEQAPTAANNEFEDRLI
jgi:hypothetical protein